MNWSLRLVASAVVSAILITSPAIAQQESSQKETTATGVLGPAETLSGSIMMVESEKKLLIVKSASGVPYSFVITPATRITAQNQRLKLADLASRQDQRVTVRFVPTRRGNIARSIEIVP